MEEEEDNGAKPNKKTNTGTIGFTLTSNTSMKPYDEIFMDDEIGDITFLRTKRAVIKKYFPVFFVRK